MSAYLVKGVEVDLQFSAEDSSTDKMILDADFEQLDEAFRTEPKRKKKASNDKRSPFTIDCTLHRRVSKMKFIAEGVALHTFIKKQKQVGLQMILDAKFDDGFTIYFKMNWQYPIRSDRDQFYFSGIECIEPTKVFEANRIYKCQVSVEVVDSAIFKMWNSFDCGSRLHSFLEETRFCDFTIITDTGSAIQCHKLALAAGSPVFERMLETDCLETRENRLQLNVSDATIKAFLKYIYGSSVEDVFKAPYIAVELMELGHKYDIGELETSMKRLILKRADKWLNIDAGLKLFLYSVLKEGNEYQELKEKGLRVMKAERDELNESEVFQRLLRDEPDTITDLFKVLLQS